jgi:hypothetical protein
MRFTRAFATKTSSYLLVGLLLTLVCLAAWTQFRPCAVISVNGQLLGHLPGGVRKEDLNLLLIAGHHARRSVHAYGFDAIETPNLDRLAREGVLFEQAVSPAPLTLPAHSSIFTGTFPPAHGVRDNGGFFLDERQTTLAERLQSRGFTTGGFVGAYVLDHKWGVAQGFQTYFDDFDLSKYPVALARRHRSTPATRSPTRRSRGSITSARSASSAGSISTTRTLRTIRQSRSSRATPGIRMWGRSPSSIRNSAGCSAIWMRITSPIARSSW